MLGSAVLLACIVLGTAVFAGGVWFNDAAMEDYLSQGGSALCLGSATTDRNNGERNNLREGYISSAGFLT